MTEMETKASVAKVKALMASLGVTMEHLGAKVSSTAKAAKKAVLGKPKPASAKKAAAKRAGAGTVKYRHPKTGATWSGFGRPPAWLAEAKSRDHYLVDNAATGSTAAAESNMPAKKSAKTAKAATAGKVAAKKITKAAKKATAVKSAPAKKRVAGKSTAKSAAKKSTPRKAAAKKAAVAPAAGSAEGVVAS